MTVEAEQKKWWSVLTCLLLATVTALGQNSTTTTLTASTTTPAFGANVTFTATVTGASPTGTVTFTGNIYNTLGTCTLSNGSCTFNISNLIPGDASLVAGAQSLVATYGGDGNNRPSQSPPVTVTTGPRTLTSSTTTLLVSPISGSYGTSFTLTARVAPAAATGWVTFRNGSTVLGTAPILPSIVSGSIPYTFFGLTVNSSFLTPAVNYWTNRSWNNQQDVSWSANNPANGTYAWTNLDAWVAANVKAGRDMIYNFARTPRWASLYPNTQGDYGLGQCAPPASLTYWDNYVTAIATRYPQIKYWEIWNEPEAPSEYCGATAGSNGPILTMVTMSQHAYTIIKGINPSAVILSPALDSWYPNGLAPAWMTSFINQGGIFDIFAFHGYIANPGMAEDEATIVSNIQSVMTSANMSKPLWDTEAGWYTGSQPVLPFSRQQGFIAKMYIIQQSLGVQRFLWYQYQDAPQWGQMYNTSTGDNANVAAYNTVYGWLTGATLSTPCSVTAGVETCGYTRPGGYVAQAVWRTNSSGSSYAYSYPPGMTNYLDVTGASHSLSGGTVTIGDAPILLENKNIPLPSATFSTTALPVGTNSITATYSGDTYNAASTSLPSTVTISSGPQPPSNLQVSVR